MKENVPSYTAEASQIDNIYLATSFPKNYYN